MFLFYYRKAFVLLKYFDLLFKQYIDTKALKMKEQVLFTIIKICQDYSFVKLRKYF